MKYFLALVLCAGLVGCGDDDKKKTGPTAGGEFKPLLVASDCNSGNVETTLNGQWYTLTNDQDAQITLGLNFSGGVVTVTNACNFRSIVLNTSANTTYRVNENQIEVLGYDSGTSRETVRDISYECSTDIEPMVIEYQLRGSCLVFGDGRGKSMYFKRSL